MKLRVQVNEEASIVGGAEELDSLTALVSCRNLDGTLELSLDLVGSVAAENKVETWIPGRKLAPGDVVQISVLGKSSVVAAAGERSDDSGERLYYELSKAAYLRLRSKYEPHE